MKKTSAYSAWKMMIAGLPRGIAMFVVAVVGVCLGVPLLIVGVGIPILAGTMSWCEKRMAEDSRRWGTWGRGAQRTQGAQREQQQGHRPTTAQRARELLSALDGEEAFAGDEALGGQVAIGSPQHEAGSPWRQWLRTLAQPRGYFAVFYNIAQFPLSIALFCLSVVLPAVVFGLMLAPAAYKVSSYLYGYELFQDDVVFNLLLPPLSPFQRSLVVAGIGLLLFLFLSAMLRACGRLYEGWTIFFGGGGSRAAATEQSAPGTAGMLPSREFEPEQTMAPLH
ncbi:sensor domain-containing protein [Cohnella zeiphila]|uniref:Sensor domain-containing protein n=1 Tax=Cohnella zeiphila TaxID=2761120 RepID=A0A7X0SMB8_9BACL|nr:sensor domain-containing protein [Cohnella zeiphila]MBB6732529.1 sensor domain-containing protein [Cohnella zeiphila]